MEALRMPNRNQQRPFNYDRQSKTSTAKIAANLVELFPDAECLRIETPTDSPTIIEAVKDELIQRGLKIRLKWRRPK
jgi:hypothetical protein